MKILLFHWLFLLTLVAAADEGWSKYFDVHTKELFDKATSQPGPETFLVRLHVPYEQTTTSNTLKSFFKGKSKNKTPRLKILTLHRTGNTQVTGKEMKEAVSNLGDWSDKKFTATEKRDFDLTGPNGSPRPHLDIQVVAGSAPQTSKENAEKVAAQMEEVLKNKRLKRAAKPIKRAEMQPVPFTA